MYTRAQRDPRALQRRLGGWVWGLTYDAPRDERGVSTSVIVAMPSIEISV